MSFRAYNKVTTLYLASHRAVKTTKVSFSTMAAAKAAITREAKLGSITANDFAVAETMDFHNNIEKSEIVKNLMSGTPVTQRVNTPWCCNPSSETYWSS